MSLPSSERLPNDINDLPPARQRHIRRQPRSASLAERQILLNSLVKLTAPTPAFFLRAFIGALAAGGGLYLNDPVILLIAIVLLPFHAPLFGLALLPRTLKLKQFLKSLISLLILLALTFGAGMLAGFFQEMPSPDRLSIFRFSALYWLDLSILGISILLSALVLVRQGQVPQGVGVLLSYTLLIPFAVSGFGLTNGVNQLGLGALLTGFTHLGFATVLAILAFLILGFPPNKTLGWILTVVTFMVTLALISASLNISFQQTPISQSIPPTPTHLEISSTTPAPQASATSIRTATIAIPITTPTWTPSASHSSTPSATPTPTAEPTTFWGMVDSIQGAVIRENPAFDALVIAYANNGDQIEILSEEVLPDGTTWFQVRTAEGKTGWLLGSLLNTQTPTPTQQN